MPAGKIQVLLFSDQFLRLITYTRNTVYYTVFFMPTVTPAGNSACGYGSPQITPNFGVMHWDYLLKGLSVFVFEAVMILTVIFRTL